MDSLQWIKLGQVAIMHAWLPGEVSNIHVPNACVHEHPVALPEHAYMIHASPVSSV